MAARRRGTMITLRRAQTTGGPNPLQIPPIVENPEIAAAQAIGDTVLSIGAATANGALVPGDLITVDGNTYTVQTQTASTAFGVSPAGFFSVPISPALSTAVSPGDAVTLSFSADQDFYANINSYALQQVNEVIQAADLQILLPAWDTITASLITQPQETDKIVFNGQVLSIISCLPQFIQGQVVTYRIQARA
jgi:hypothetical protein